MELVFLQQPKGLEKPLRGCSTAAVTCTFWALEGAGYDHLGATGPGTQAALRSRHKVLDAFILVSPGWVQCSFQ